MPDKRGQGISEKAALRGEPSYVWRAGQERRLKMIHAYGGKYIKKRLLVNGTGLGEYQACLTKDAELVVGLDIEFPRLAAAKTKNRDLVCAAGEHLPFADNQFNAVLSNEVIEHVQDDRAAVAEIARTIKKDGRFILFCPNRGYPFETHGIYWRGEYRFGNKLFVNYLPRALRDRLAPHVRAYTRRDLRKLFVGLDMEIVFLTTIFGAYDNIIEKAPLIGNVLRTFLHFFEKTPLNRLGLSHFWVLRKVSR